MTQTAIAIGPINGLGTEDVEFVGLLTICGIKTGLITVELQEDGSVM